MRRLYLKSIEKIRGNKLFKGRHKGHKMASVFEITTFKGQTDAGEVITIVDRDWSPVLKNGRNDSLSECTDNCNLRNHISGPEIQHLLNVVFERVQASQTPIDFLYCCDTNGVRRYMMLEIVPVDSRVVVLRSRTLLKDQREYVPSSGESTESPGELLRMCSWCKKLHTDSWVDVEDAIRLYRLLEHKNVPLISHTICEGCRDTVLGSSHDRAERAS